MIRIHSLEVVAWVAFFFSFISQNITLIAGLSATLLSFTGIVLNIIKIYKNTKDEN